MSGIRQAIVLGAIPVIVGVVYFIVQEVNGSFATLDPAGVTMLVALGFAMGFGMLVILRGARDL